MMVGSELPSPQATESTVTDVVQLSLQDVTLADEAGRHLLDGHHASRSTGARCSASPASRATARPSWSRP